MARVSRRTAAGGDGTYPNVALDSAYRGKFGGKNFDELSDNQKDEVIKDLEDDSLKLEGNNGKEFLDLILSRGQVPWRRIIGAGGILPSPCESPVPFFPACDTTDVRFWHKADIPRLSSDEADISRQVRSTGPTSPSLVC